MKTNGTYRSAHARAALAMAAACIALATACFALASCDQGAETDADKKTDATSSATPTDERSDPAPNGDASLSSLVLSEGTLSPAFSAGVASYAATVPNATAAITATPTANAAGAAIKGRVNGGEYSAIASGAASGNLALNVGTNEVSILVTAEKGATAAYTVTVTRERLPGTGLASLVLSAGTLSPAFSAGVTSYAATVTNATAAITVTPTAANPKGTVTVNGTACAAGNPSLAIPLAEGTNAITVVTKDESGENAVAYALAVTRMGAVPTLTLSFKYGDDGNTTGSNVYVAWIETTGGTVIQNLTVCKRLLDGSLTHTALPFWKCNRYDAAQVTVDAVTGPTKPKQDFSVTKALKDPSVAKFKVCFETDRSFDRNDWFDDQPALLYSAEVDLADPKPSYELELEAWTPNEGTVGQIAAYFTDPPKTGEPQTVLGFITHFKATPPPTEKYAFGAADTARSSTRSVKGITLKVE